MFSFELVYFASRARVELGVRFFKFAQLEIAGGPVLKALQRR
jgi:hypothetical protein